MWKGRNGNSNRHTWCRLARWFDVQMWYTLVRYLCASLLYIERWCFITTYGYFVVTCGAYLNCSVSFFFLIWANANGTVSCVRTYGVYEYFRTENIHLTKCLSEQCLCIITEQTDSRMTHKSSLQMDMVVEWKRRRNIQTFESMNNDNKVFHKETKEKTHTHTHTHAPTQFPWAN